MTNGKCDNTRFSKFQAWKTHLHPVCSWISLISCSCSNIEAFDPIFGPQVTRSRSTEQITTELETYGGLGGQGRLTLTSAIWLTLRKSLQFYEIKDHDIDSVAINIDSEIYLVLTSRNTIVKNICVKNPYLCKYI